MQRRDKMMATTVVVAVLGGYTSPKVCRHTISPPLPPAALCCRQPLRQVGETRAANRWLGIDNTVNTSHVIRLGVCSE